MQTTEQRYWPRYSFFIVNFEHISYLFYCLLLTLNNFNLVLPACTSKTMVRNKEEVRNTILMFPYVRSNCSLWKIF